MFTSVKELMEKITHGVQAGAAHDPQDSAEATKAEAQGKDAAQVNIEPEHPMTDPGDLESGMSTYMPPAIVDFDANVP